jgi:hypothetical protein
MFQEQNYITSTVLDTAVDSVFPLIHPDSYVGFLTPDVMVIGMMEPWVRDMAQMVECLPTSVRS